MAVVVPTIRPETIGLRWQRYTGGSSTADNEVLVTIPTDGALEIIAHSTLGVFDAQGSNDGTNFSAVALALEDMHSTTPATRVSVSTADRAVRITNPGFKFVRFLQASATATTNFSVAVRVK